MTNIRFRLAKPCDAEQIANCHWHVRDRYSQGIFLSLGKSFLKAYYKIILNDPYEVVTCAERDDGKIIGFCSATIDAKKQAENLKSHKIYLGISAIMAIIKKPSLLKAVWQRYKSLSSTSNTPNFVHVEGVRCEYWCWMKDEEDILMSVELDKANACILYSLGIREVHFEVDKFNKAVYRYHVKINKCQPIEEITLPDGRVRVLLKSYLSKP